MPRDTDDNYALVKCDGCAADGSIVRILRVYLSQRRAEEDLTLLEQTDGTSTYRVIPVEYIDN